VWSALVLAVLLFAGFVVIEIFVDGTGRRSAMRLATAAVLALATLRIRTLVRLHFERQARSGFDAATLVATGVSGDRTRFHQLHDEVRFGAKSGKYFDLVFWPRLNALARASSGAPLPKPPGRSFGRGPSIEDLAALVAAVERRR
jgi:hypothetical protein